MELSPEHKDPCRKCIVTTGEGWMPAAAVGGLRAPEEPTGPTKRTWRFQDGGDSCVGRAGAGLAPGLVGHCLRRMCADWEGSWGGFDHPWWHVLEGLAVSSGGLDWVFRPGSDHRGGIFRPTEWPLGSASCFSSGPFEVPLHVSSLRPTLWGRLKIPGPGWTSIPLRTSRSLTSSDCHFNAISMSLAGGGQPIPWGRKSAVARIATSTEHPPARLQADRVTSVLADREMVGASALIISRRVVRAPKNFDKPW